MSLPVACGCNGRECCRCGCRHGDDGSSVCLIPRCDCNIADACVTVAATSSADRAPDGTVLPENGRSIEAQAPVLRSSYMRKARVSASREDGWGLLTSFGAGVA